MKKILFCLLAVATLASCVDNDPVLTSNDSGTSWTNLRLEVQRQDWILEGEPDGYSSYYYVDFNIPELDRNIFKEGAVLMYIQTNPDNPDRKSSMPMNVYWVENINNTEYYWTQSFEYDFTRGSVSIYCKYSDFLTNTRGKPGGEIFHLVLIY